MDVQTIPTSTTKSHYTQRVQIDDVDYTFNFAWNQRQSLWYFDIYNAAGTALVVGRPVLANWGLTALDLTAGLPPGEIYAVDASAIPADPGLRDLGDRVILAYVTT